MDTHFIDGKAAPKAMGPVWGPCGEISGLWEDPDSGLHYRHRSSNPPGTVLPQGLCNSCFLCRAHLSARPCLSIPSFGSSTAERPS